MNDAHDRLLRRKEVEDLTGLGTTSIYKFMKAGSFPRAVRVSAGAVRWRLSEVNAWIASRTAAPATV